MKWDGSAAGAAPVINWVLASGGDARWHGEYPDVTVQISPAEYMKLPAQPAGIFLETSDGRLPVQPGDYVIRGVRGEFYPCDYETFQQIYLPLEALGHSRSSFDRYETVVYEAIGEATALRNPNTGILNDTLQERLADRVIHAARAEIYQKLADHLAESGLETVEQITRRLVELATEDRKAALGLATR